MSLMTQVPQANPKAQYLAHQEAINQAVMNVLQGGRYILSDEVECFEAEFAAYIGVKHAIGVGNGTDALYLALRACDIGPGDEVITVSHTAVATITAIEQTGAKAVFVDIEPNTYNMDPLKIEAAITKQSRAIIPVHLYGQPVNMNPVLSIAHTYGLRVIEDCAQAHGATYFDRKVGSFGDMAAFSFYPTKNLGAIGDGGMVVTNNNDLAKQTRLLRQYGWRERYISDLHGWNSRLDEIQAAILRVKLPYLDQDNQKRREIAAIYDNTLKASGLILPHVNPNVEHVFHQYVLRTNQRDNLRAYLSENGIGTAIHYPVPVHQQTAYLQAPANSNQLVETEKAASQILSLPIFPELSLEQACRVAETINQWQA